MAQGRPVDETVLEAQMAASEAETEPLLDESPPKYQPSPAYPVAPVMMAVEQPAKPEEWQASLLGCCADWTAAKTTTKTVLCPCVAYGANRDRIMHSAIHGVPHPTQGNTCSAVCTAYTVVLTLPHFGPIAAAMLRTVQRTQLRTLFGIPGNPFKDCLASTFCGPCSLVQVRRELDLREREGQVALEETVAEVAPLVDSKTAPPPSYTV